MTETLDLTEGNIFASNVIKWQASWIDDDDYNDDYNDDDWWWWWWWWWVEIELLNRYLQCFLKLMWCSDFEIWSMLRTFVSSHFKSNCCHNLLIHWNIRSKIWWIREATLGMQDKMSLILSLDLNNIIIIILILIIIFFSLFKLWTATWLQVGL